MTLAPFFLSNGGDDVVPMLKKKRSTLTLVSLVPVGDASIGHVQEGLHFRFRELVEVIFRWLCGERRTVAVDDSP